MGLLFLMFTPLLFLEELLISLDLHNGTDLLLYPFKENEEDGNGEEDGECADNHASDNTYTDGTVTIGTSAAGEEQRHHTKHAGEYSHEDRTQTCLASSVSGLNDTHSLTTTFEGELGDEDSGLGQQTDEHNHTCLQVDVVLNLSEDIHILTCQQTASATGNEVPQPGEAEAAHQTCRDGEDDGERHEETLVEAGKDEEDEDDADGVDQDGLVATHLFKLLTADAAIFIGDMLGHHLFVYLVNDLHGVANSITLCRLDHAGDFRKEVEVGIDFRTQYRLEFRKL